MVQPSFSALCSIFWQSLRPRNLASCPAVMGFFDTSWFSCFTMGSAPPSRSRRIMSGRSSSTATTSGVWPMRFFPLRSAPLAARSLITSARSNFVAWWRQPRSLLQPFWRSSFTHSTSPPAHASARGDSPSLFRASTSTPATPSKKMFTPSLFFLNATSCRGVMPLLAAENTAPFSRRCLMALLLPALAASRRAVSPALFFSFTSEPLSRRKSSTSVLMGGVAAARKGVVPSLSLAVSVLPSSSSSMNCSTRARCEMRQAQWMGSMPVLPASKMLSSSCATNTCTASRLPMSAARISGVLPCLSDIFGSAPWSRRFWTM
mmetsp:Transcript_8242/g.34610  ORF Transcript_8242/g.34610 Transcript_8242/m.34610 type:complete len:319 (+) Transcript_8242:104-1060(+)